MPLSFFLVPGNWVGPQVYRPLEAVLTAEGHAVRTTSLKMTGTKPPGNPTIADNTKGIRDDLVYFIDEEVGREVIVVLHSASGHFGAAALQDLGVDARRAAGKTGGITKLVFLAALTSKEGDAEAATPDVISVSDLEKAGVLKVEDGQHSLVDPRGLLYGDLPDDEAAKYVALMKPEPVPGWDIALTYMGWRDLPSYYIICDGDKIVPPSLQEAFATQAGCTVLHMDVAHMPMVSHPRELAQVLVGIAAK